MLQSLGQNAERQSLSATNCFLACLPICQHTRQIDNFRDPGAVVLALYFDNIHNDILTPNDPDNIRNAGFGEGYALASARV